MTDSHDHNLWNMLYNQTPIAIRWLIGILTSIALVLAGVIMKNRQKVFDQHQEKFADALNEHHEFRKEITTLGEHHNYMDTKIDTVHDEFKTRFDNVDSQIEQTRKEVSKLTTHLINHLQDTEK